MPLLLLSRVVDCTTSVLLLFAIHMYVCVCVMMCFVVDEIGSTLGEGTFGKVVSCIDQ